MYKGINNVSLCTFSKYHFLHHHLIFKYSRNVFSLHKLLVVSDLKADLYLNRMHIIEEPLTFSQTLLSSVNEFIQFNERLLKNVRVSEEEEQLIETARFHIKMLCFDSICQ